MLALLSPDIPVCCQQHLPAVRLRTTTAPPALRLPDCTPDLQVRRSRTSQSTFDALAQAYTTPRNIQLWLLAGASPRTLALEIGALLLHPKVDAGRLDDMRALLHRHKKLLQDTAKWPVPHVVEQLAAQDLGASVQQEATDGSGEGMCRLIECITPNAQACRWSIEGDDAVRSVAFSPDMLKLARGEGYDAIVCCAVSGLEFRRLVGHR